MKAIDDILKREGQMRAALRRKYFIRPGGVARWVKGREENRLRIAERNKAHEAKGGKWL